MIAGPGGRKCAHTWWDEHGDVTLPAGKLNLNIKKKKEEVPESTLCAHVHRGSAMWGHSEKAIQEERPHHKSTNLHFDFEFLASRL